eukprot:4961708-Prymnesium_polylepis.1
MKGYEEQYRENKPRMKDGPRETFEARVRHHAIVEMKNWFTTTAEGQERMRRTSYSSTDTSTAAMCRPTEDRRTSATAGIN